MVAQIRVLDKRIVHLRTGPRPEWSNFGGTPKTKLVIQFNALQNETEETLALKQEDVKQRWLIQLNGQELGKLEQDEQAMMIYFRISPLTLHSGSNKLIIRQLDTIADDIRVGKITLIHRPVQQLLNQAIVEVSVEDGQSHTSIPARITIINSANCLQPVGALSNQHLAVRTGCIYTQKGLLPAAPVMKELLQPAAPSVKRGFRAFELGWQASENARKEKGLK